ncbi:MAG: phage tail sheath subtilisin-like domain-containing protein [Gammaproteobacteria bacterium]|nr:phage tail sheath subtilisin-like domain-containing protein [Gammaproteobacteria bacterium]
MAETFSTSELVIPGTFVRVRAEGLISVGGISTGNIGIVGTAAAQVDVTNAFSATHNLSDYESAKKIFAAYDTYSGDSGTLNLMRALEILYRNGARTVYTRAVPTSAATPADFTAALNELVKENINIIIAPELSTSDAISVLPPILESSENSSQDLIAVIGADDIAVTDIIAERPTNDRIIYTAPGFEAFDAVAKANVNLSGKYSAAAIAGLVSTLTPESSPTNKVLSGVSHLAQRFSYGELKQLTSARVMTLEERGGVRVVRGITTDDGAFTQVTTRRITDFAKAGIRKASDPFIGKLNNQRVRKALQGSIDSFLTTMVIDEQLIGYQLEVTATRADEIAGRAIVNAVIQPTFSIDFVAVTLVLE